MPNLLRHIPSVNELMESPPLRRLLHRVNRNVLVSGVRQFLEDLRNELKNTAADMKPPASLELAERIAEWILAENKPNLRPVINATGILLHTGLGRAPLAKEAVDAIVEVAQGYASVEVDVESGERSQRVLDVQKSLRRLTGAEAALVVNNNAGATMLALSALAAGREVIVSRGQLVEIGGSYRLPDVMEVSGAKLCEVGTTNKTRIGDYQNAIHENTAALMRVHTSNYRVVGFTAEPTLQEMIDLSVRSKLPLIDDIGSGAMHDFSRYGIEDEPIAPASVKAGADVVLFSGDKLMGGPQCGIAVGRKAMIQKMQQHPMMRALRVDKITLAALDATLRLHQSVESAERSVPLMAMLSTPVANLQNRAERMAPQLSDCEAIEDAQPIASHTFLGGGSVPRQEIETWCVAMTPAKKSVDALATKLRLGKPCVFGRIHKDRLLLDLRSVSPQQDIELIEAIRRVE